MVDTVLSTSTRVAIIYHMFPHYRLPVMRALDSSDAFSFSFFGDSRIHEGIEVADPLAVRSFHSSTFYRIGRVFWQNAAIWQSIRSEFTAVVFLANPNFVSTWLGALLARATGKKVLFWAHGWLRPEYGLKRVIRNLFFRLAHLVLVYGERAKDLGEQSGFPASRIKVIYNSLDYDSAREILHSIRSGGRATTRPQDFFPENAPILICTARLTPLCELDLLLEAAALLKERGFPVNILLVGDGPARPSLELLAKQSGVSVYFWGACYEESILGQLIYHSDIMVQPGKMGLTVIHSMMYGTPAITHGDMNQQMPEAEAIISGQTGLFFERGNALDLADRIFQWLNGEIDREQVRLACEKEIEAKWNPHRQKQLIEEALRFSLSRGGPQR